MEKENAMPMRNKQILPPTIGLDRRSGSAASSGPAAGGRQHKLKQRFTVIRKLGKGTYGKVQLAVNKETGQEVAIKTIKKTKIENEQDLERVRREIQIMSSIEHPHIIHIYEVFENKDKIVLIMQYAPGGELYEYVSQSKVLDEAEARRLFRQVAAAIYYCHKNKICHRDLKLENILLDEKNNAKLADFGLSNVFDKSRQLKTFCGSPLYASPEIVQGSPYEGPEVDCWSMGVLLYTLVYGAMPFDSSNFKRLVKQISEASYHEPKQRSQASPLISRLLCADPARRATIFDICQDPWVNGHHSLVPPSLPSPSGGQQPPASPSSPNSAQQQQQAHTSLLKVAQDMASLTPVRLDILLALAPAATPASDTKSTHKPQREASDERAPKRKASLTEDDATRATRQQQQQARQTKLMDQLDGPSLMEVDEDRATSPVASYRVRDLSAESEPRPEEQTVNGLANDTNEPSIVHAPQEGLEERPHSGSHNKMSEQEAIESGAEILRQAKLENIETEAGETQDSAIVIEEHICDKKPEETVDANQEQELNDSQPTETRENELLAVETGEKEIGTSGEGPQNEQLEKHAGPDESAIQPNQRKPEESTHVPSTLAKDEPEHFEDHDHQEAEAERSCKIEDDGEKGIEEPETTTDAAKPKKVRKKIIVVKKKKKVARKEAEQEAEQEGEQEGADVSESKDKDPKASGRNADSPSASKKGSISSGPRKVRIPDTFKPSADSTTPTSTLSRASRRQSALIADVSHKLLQQPQHPPSTAAIEEDQKQLANVRVSDKKSDFERRASLATKEQQQQQQRSGSISPRGSHDAGATGELDENSAKIAAYEPEFADSRLERTRVDVPTCQTIVEPVNRLEPSTSRHLKPIEPAQESTTPTATISASGSFSQAASERTDATDSSLPTNPNEDRSDSVETIKAEADFGTQERLSPRQASVRSSLQINLGPAREELDRAFEQRRSSGSVAGSSSGAALAPITRSYKKVTFTKDGSCVTETGRIYSTQDHDGTMRRIERKSKVTHYPSESGSGQGGGGGAGESAVEETHEEIVYEDGANFWPSDSHRQPTSLQRDRPLERLVMPSDNYYDQLEQDHAQFRPSRASMEHMDSASSCSSGSTDVFDDIFDTWTGAISMFSKRNTSRLSGLRDTLMNRAFGSATPASASQQPHASPSLFRQHNSCSLAGNPQERCGSVEPPRGLFDGFHGFPRMRRHHHHHRHHRNPNPNTSSGRSSVDASGYESDVPIDRPASAAAGTRQRLGSARGLFGSSNLGALPRHQPSGATASLFDESLAAPNDDDDIFASLNRGANLDPFGGSLLMQEIQLEQEKMRRRMAQQRTQLWKTSTPALNEIPDGELSSVPVCIEQRFVRTRADSSSSGSHQQQQQQQQGHPASGQQQARRVVTTVYKTLHQPSGQPGQLNQSQSSGGVQRLIRQSAPLDSTPTRRNTANLSDHLPPRQPASVRRSTSKTSSLTNQMAGMRIGENLQQTHSASAAGPSQRHTSASFIELKRNSSSSSSNQQTGATLRQDPVASHSGGSSSVICEAPLTPSTGHSNLSNSLNNRLAQRMVSGGGGQQENEANSRIQNWLQQSSGNLSVSSGSKSSASDTLPSSGRSDVASSALRRDESVGTTVTSSSIFSSQLRQRQLEAGQLHHVPASASARSHVTSSRQTLIVKNAPQSTCLASSMAVRSSSKQSLGPANTPLLERMNQRTLSEAQHRAEEKVVSVGGVKELEDSSEMFARKSTSSNTAQASSHSSLRFAFAAGDVGEQKVVDEQQVFTTKQQFITHRLMSPQMVSSAPIGADACFQQELASSSGTKQGFVDDGFTDDFDSLVGSGAELDSISSSSLLDQLRARGYRSMINQRLVNTHQHQQAGQQSADPNVITTSSTSITMSSSGVGGAQPEEERAGQQQRPQANESVAKLIANHQQADKQAQLQPAPHDKQQVELTQQDATFPLNGLPAADGPTNENGKANERGVSAACATGCERGAQVAANLANPNEAPAEDEDVREAKANIKGYLDRMREMEAFLKSMHEEEERFQKQRQDMFLFNNLLLSAKLTGLNSKNSFEPAFNGSGPVGPTAAVRSRGHSSAPIRSGYAAFESVNSNGFLASVRPTEESSASASASRLPYQRTASVTAPTVSCFSSDLYKPSIGVPSAPTPRARSPLAPEDYSHDPLLEPVQPLQLSYQPPVGMAAGRNTWRRSKSQLGDQFTDYPSHNPSTRAHAGRASSNFSPATSCSRRPLAANIDSMPRLAAPSSSPYFAARQRRSVSQVRHSSVVAASSGHESEMVSEYKSSFGPNLSHRSARSPLRARPTSPQVSPAVQHKSDNEIELDDEHDDMRDYRASNYVPKVVPDCTPTRRGRSLSRRSSTLEIGSTSIGRSTLAGASDAVSDEPSERRKSLQTAPRLLRADSRERERSASPANIRRLSLASSGEHFLGSKLDNSRLSELEQRIESNKKRRQELLSGINNAPAASSFIASRSHSVSNGAPARWGEDEADETDAFGFERPTRPSGSSNQPDGRPAANSTPARPSTGSSGSGSPRSRPSRLESMEARIKRRSYCVRVSSPERTRAKSSRPAAAALERRPSVAHEAVE